MLLLLDFDNLPYLPQIFRLITIYKRTIIADGKPRLGELDTQHAPFSPCERL